MSSGISSLKSFIEAGKDPWSAVVLKAEAGYALDTLAAESSRLSTDDGQIREGAPEGGM